jgi:iron complex outermembrane receptor protein
VIEVTQLAFATFGGVILEGYVKRQVFLVRLLIGSTALGGVSAFAQQAAAQAQAAAPAPVQQGDGEIIVTATRRSESLQTVPVSVSAVTAQSVAQRGITNVQSLAVSIPNLSVRPAPATKSAAMLTIRGQVQRDNLITLDPSVGVYVDDIYLSRAYSALNELLDPERVEVLRGPQGTLFGRNTIGGAIRVITAKPDTSAGLTGFGYAGIGNYGMLEMGAAVTVPIVQDRLAIRYAGNIRKRNGYTSSYLVSEPYTGDNSIIRKIDTDDEQITSHRLSVRWQPTESTTLDASYYLFEENSNGVMIANVTGDISTATITSADPFAFTTSKRTSPQRQDDFFSALTPIRPYSRARSEIAQATLAQEIGDNITFKAIGSYSKSRNNSHTNGSGIVTDSIALVEFSPELSQKQRQYTGEVQLYGNAFGDQLDWISGLYYFSERGSDFSPATTRVFGSTASAVAFSGVGRNKSKSAFASLTYHVTPELSIRGGGRYTIDDKAFSGSTRRFSGACVYEPGEGVITSTEPGGPCSLDRSNTYKYWIWDAGIDYKFSNMIFGYLKAGNGVRGGGQQSRAVNTATADAFAPDKVVNYEAGIKAQLFNRKWLINAAVFHTDYSNVQQTYIVGPPVAPTTTTVIVNQGSADVNGFEVETNLRLSSALSVSGSVGYTDISLANKAIVAPFVNRWKYSGAVNLEQPIGNVTLLGQLTYDHSGKFYATQDPTIPNVHMDGSDLVGARLAVRLDNGLELAIWGRNLTNDKYFTYATVTADVIGATVGAPRTYGAQARFTF